LTAGDIAALLVFFMAISISIDVVLRYVFNSPTMWINEASSYILMVITFFGLAYTLKERAHISVDVIFRKLPLSVQYWVTVIHSVLFLITVATLLKLTLNLFLVSFVRGSTSNTMWNVPLAPWQVCIPLGLGITCLLLICNIYRESKIAIDKFKKRSQGAEP